MPPYGIYFVELDFISSRNCFELTDIYAVS